ncbi:galactosyltransferase family protein [Medicago truncatula]|uniref:Galactosyltransferase family protein n=1 Tax=Medicago truncatula TaxID=3880 RepID=A0A072TDJ9_MEDTR|nr:galactosyltransferase family protein [Medicago truncatula]
MTSSRVARFFMEVAPPQYVSVMRHRTSKMMETIAEEDREINSHDNVISLPKTLRQANKTMQDNLWWLFP